MPTAPTMPALLTAGEVARELRVQESTVYRWARDGRMPCVRVNGVVRFRARELDEIVSSGGAHDEDDE